MTVRDAEGPAAGTGELLRRLREERLLPIAGLASAAGVSVRAIGDLERGVTARPRAATLAALARGLGLTPPEAALLESVGRAEPLVGRERELRRLRDLAAGARRGDGPPPVLCLHGPPGSGKTFLALRAVAAVHDLLPAPPVLVDLAAGGHGPPSRPVPDGGVLVLDGAGAEAEVRPLLPAAGRVLTVVTGRRALSGLEGVVRLPVPPLTGRAAVELLAVRAGAGRVAAEPAAAARVALLCDGLPAALRRAAEVLETGRERPLARLAARLTPEHGRLAALGGGSLAELFDPSVRALSAVAARAFRCLAGLSAVEFDREDAARLCGSDPDLASALEETLDEALDPALDELVESGLVQAAAGDRYRLLPLLRLHAGNGGAGERAEVPHRRGDGA
ncbi:helix-turn-helix domain-containing protein [Kitasatospora purpeofusca]|uniref:helix-turn-helix domain-containing protein n=1 Tax=Kitasatospora purpeofusca TaxID=67352 RepID=UPI002253B351|nr:helix-turn-helix domain-containing protein [Kitasatospora purpeofusca]MCX4690203.1 helix-turn-helix domain-containing protein [Kitasatospora purpeofusca]